MGNEDILKEIEIDSLEGCESTVPYFLPLKNKIIIIGMTGGIAVCKAVEYARNLKRLGARVIPVMTSSAEKFITKITVAALTGEKVWSDLFEEDEMWNIPHIDLARKADLFLLLPATANIIAKAASGIADDLLSTLILSYNGPIICCPAMNPTMFEKSVVKANIKKIKEYGFFVVEPGYGDTACGEGGQGRLAKWDVVMEEVLKSMTKQTLIGRKVIVSAGPTREPIDPVRYISNRSSGRMGFSIAREAYRRGAEVNLVTGPVSIAEPAGVKVIKVNNASEMARHIKALVPESDVVVMSAAVADYRPVSPALSKIKKGENTINMELEKTEDILSGLSSIVQDNTFVVGFCAETEQLIDNAMLKLKKKKLDLIVANDISRKDSGFDVANNMVVMIGKNEQVRTLPLLSKEEVAVRIWERIEELAF